MATLQTTETRPGGDSHADGKAYFETDTNKFIVWNATASAWIELDSAGTGSAFTNSFGADLTNNSYFTPAGGSYTISGNKSFSTWVKPTSGSFHYLWGYGTNLYALYLDSSAVSIRMWPSGQGGGSGRTYQRMVSPVTFTNGSWHNIIITGDGTDLKLYVNGQAATSTYTDNDDWYFETAFRAGSAGSYFNGHADEFAFFNSVLSAQDASDIYGSGTPSSLSDYSPVVYARFGDGESVTSGDDIASVPNASPATGTALSAAAVTDKPSYLDLTGETISV
jgi:hypothetical protein